MNENKNENKNENNKWNKTEDTPPSAKEEIVVALTVGSFTGKWIPVLISPAVVSTAPDEYPYWSAAKPLPPLLLRKKE